MMNTRKQLFVYILLLLVNALMPLLMYMLVPLSVILSGQPLNPAVQNWPPWLMGLANSGIVLVIYGPLGLLGYYLARRLELPGIFRPGAGDRALLLQPLAAGSLLGILLTGMDWLFGRFGDWSGFVHPQFPISIFASVSAGIGEEILHRLFLLSLWAFLLNLVFKRWDHRPVVLWAANFIAALAFAASHLPALMILTGASSPAQLPVLSLVELFFLNVPIGLLAGQAYIKNGLVAAAGIHFWADFWWHILLPLILA